MPPTKGICELYETQMQIFPLIMTVFYKRKCFSSV